MFASGDGFFVHIFDVWVKTSASANQKTAATTTQIKIKTTKPTKSKSKSKSNKKRLESTLSYGMERVWALGVVKGSNSVALGFDEVGG